MLIKTLVVSGIITSSLVGAQLQTGFESKERALLQRLKTGEVNAHEAFAVIDQTVSSRTDAIKAFALVVEKPLPPSWNSRICAVEAFCKTSCDTYSRHVMQALLSYMRFRQKSPLHAAVMLGNDDAVDFFLNTEEPTKEQLKVAQKQSRTSIVAMLSSHMKVKDGSDSDEEREFGLPPIDTDALEQLLNAQYGETSGMFAEGL